MYISKTKTNSGTTYYLIESYYDYDSKKKSTKIVERLGTKEELEKKFGSNVDLEKCMKDYAIKKTEEAKEKNKDFVINIKQYSKNQRNKNFGKNVGYLYLKKLLNDLGIKKICRHIDNKENLKFDIYNVLVNILCNKVMFAEKMTLSTYKFSKLLLQNSNIKTTDVVETLKLIAKYSLYIQTEFYKNIRNNTECDEEMLFYDCGNYSIANSNIAYILNVKHNRIYLSRIFIDSNGFPCVFHLEDSSETTTYNEKKKIRKFLRTYFKDASIHILPESIQSGKETKIFRKFKQKYTMTIQKISSFNDDLNDWALDKNGWKRLSSNRNFNLDRVIGAIESNETNYDKALNYAGTMFYKCKSINISIPETSDHISQYFYLGFNYDYLIEQEEYRNRLINSVQKSLEYKIHNALSKKQVWRRKSAINHLLNNQYITEGQEENTLYFDDSKLRKDQRYDGLYSICENFIPKDVESILKPVFFKLNQYDYIINRYKDEREKNSDITYNEYLLSHYVICILSSSLLNYISYKTDYKYPVTQVVDFLTGLNFSKVHTDGWMSLFSANDLMDELKKITNIDLDFQFLSLKQMQNIIHDV